MKRKPTMIDVARRAGVSVATVSRALNGGPVSADATAVVRSAVRDLGYRTNRLAKGLVTGRSGVIGVVVPDLLGPLYAAMAHGIEDVLVERGMHAVLATDERDAGKERASIELLMARQVDGLVLVGSGLDDQTLADVAAEVPLVLVQRESAGVRFPGIAIDNAHGVALAVDHLLAAGHDALGYVGGVRRDGRERADAFRARLARHHLEPAIVVEADFSEEGGVAAGEQLLASGRASAVLCANDRMAVGVYHTLAKRGLRVPNDLSVIGFDDLPWVRYLDPPLTTVRQPARHMGRLAVEHLFDSAADGPDAAEPRSAADLVRPELVARASVGPPARSARGR